jgi:hypothetical protein
VRNKNRENPVSKSTHMAADNPDITRILKPAAFAGIDKLKTINKTSAEQARPECSSIRNEMVKSRL